MIETMAEARLIPIKHSFRRRKNPKEDAMASGTVVSHARKARRRRCNMETSNRFEVAASPATRRAGRKIENVSQASSQDALAATF